MMPAAVAFALSGTGRDAGMKATVVGLVTPHLLRVVDLADQAERGMTVEWHLREAVAATMADLGDQANASALVSAYVEGLENAAAQARKVRVEYLGALQTAIDAARRLRRDRSLGERT
jgi:hypothetical protein